ncbi:MAG: hypothetical protein PHQ27_00890 [Victivallales bacterium]|nr:hypothetical protein [Victivallales bacterium]
MNNRLMVALLVAGCAGMVSAAQVGGESPMDLPGVMLECPVIPDGDFELSAWDDGALLALDDSTAPAPGDRVIPPSDRPAPKPGMDENNPDRPGSCPGPNMGAEDRDRPEPCPSEDKAMKGRKGPLCDEGRPGMDGPKHRRFGRMALPRGDRKPMGECPMAQRRGPQQMGECPMAQRRGPQQMKGREGKPELNRYLMANYPKEMEEIRQLRRQSEEVQKLAARKFRQLAQKAETGLREQREKARKLQQLVTEYRKSKDKELLSQIKDLVTEFQTAKVAAMKKRIEVGEARLGDLKAECDRLAAEQKQEVESKVETLLAE